MIYNTIHHEIRNRAGLSLIDWCLLESIYQLSVSPKSRYKTWCNAPKDYFTYLGTTRTIVNRFNKLEEAGWIEFKNSKRLLKRPTGKYFEEVIAYIQGVKKFHTKGEKVSPLGVKEFHLRGEEVSPNNNIDKDINNNTNNVYKETHEFPSNKGKKTYNPNDKRINKKIPFDVVSAKKTLDALFPKIEDLEEKYNSIFKNYAADKEIFKHCLTTFIETGISNYYTSIRDIVLLERNLLEWIKKEVIFRKRGQSKNDKPSNNSNSLTEYSAEKDARLREKYKIR